MYKYIITKCQPLYKAAKTKAKELLSRTSCKHLAGNLSTMYNSHSIKCTVHEIMKNKLTLSIVPYKEQKELRRF